MKGLKKKFPDYESYKDADITKILSPEEIEKSDILLCNQLKTVVLRNEGNLSFTSIDLPVEAQLSPMYAITSADFNNDGHNDIIMGGNQYSVVPEMGIYDGSHGLYLQNDGKLNFNNIDGGGFRVDGEIRDFIIQDNLLSVIVSRDSLITFKFNYE